MKKGFIYKLKWNGSDMVYIGKTEDKRNRLRTHVSSFKKGDHYNKAAQLMYDIYGEPTMEIVEECNCDELDKKEEYYNGVFTKQRLCINKPRKAGRPKKEIKSLAYKVYLVPEDQLTLCEKYGSLTAALKHLLK